LLVTRRTERQHPIEALNNFEMFGRLCANEFRLGSDDELAENKIFAFKSVLNWVIYDYKNYKNFLIKSFNVGYKKVIKYDLL
jgi:hypothetical protein